MTTSEHNLLIYGYGNTGRQDDALGVLIADKIKEWLDQNPVPGVDVESNFQLNIEDAATIAEYKKVIFVDASLEDIDDLMLVPVEPSDKVEFSMHAVSPGFVLKLCQDMNNHVPEALVLHVKAYEFGFLKEMTKKAAENLNKAINFLKREIEKFPHRT